MYYEGLRLQNIQFLSYGFLKSYMVESICVSLIRSLVFVLMNKYITMKHIFLLSLPVHVTEFRH